MGTEEAREQEVEEARERAILVAVRLPGQEEDEEPLEELASLAEAAGAEVVARVVQERSAIHPATFIGRGKAEELAVLGEELGADLILFDHNLTPAQARNLEAITRRTVLDRTQLILDIFARRARTRQAKLQVELAQLQYELPRYRHMWTHLSRIKGGIGMRGPGETQLEVDRRRARRRIAYLKEAIAHLQQRKAQETKGRCRFFTVALVGYTNVGKSTLMNRLTQAEVFVEDRFFATLDATTRRWQVGQGVVVLLTDTVGFIRRLPPQLIASFHATLEEVREAQLLLHVVDVSHPRMEEQMRAVRQVLEDIGCAEKPTLVVLNKADLLPPGVDREAIQRRYQGILLSALTGEGVEALQQAVLQEVLRQRQRVWVSLPAGEGRRLAALEEQGYVERREYRDSSVRLLVWLRPEDRQRWEREGIAVTDFPQPLKARGSDAI